MKSNTKLPVKQLYLILVPCAIIIFSSSIETLMRVKDLNLFQEWLLTLEQLGESQLSQNQAFDAYVTGNLINFFLKISIPISLSINSYFAYTKLRINQLFIFIWTVALLGGLAYTLVELSFYSVFYYIKIAGYLFLVVIILSLINIINESKLS